MATEAMAAGSREMLLGAGSRLCTKDDSAAVGIFFLDVGVTKPLTAQRKMAVEGRGGCSKAVAGGIAKAASWSDFEICFANRPVVGQKEAEAEAGAWNTAPADLIKEKSAGAEKAEMITIQTAGKEDYGIQTAGKVVDGGPVKKKMVRLSDAYVTHLKNLPPAKPPTVPESFFEKFPNLREVIRDATAKAQSLIDIEKDILSQFEKEGYAELDEDLLSPPDEKGYAEVALEMGY